MGIRIRDSFSGLTHLFGAFVALYGYVWLLLNPVIQGDKWAMIATHSFGFTMVLLYLSSALYHLPDIHPEKIKILRKIDHSMIYIHIAGCYGPTCLTLLRDQGGLWFFIIVWALAITGVIIKMFHIHTSRWITVSLYMGLSWLALFLLPDMWRLLEREAFHWLFANGVFMILGALVYAFKKPNPYPPLFGFHEIWHILVLAGSFCLFFFQAKVLEVI